MNNTTTELQWGDVIFKPGQRVRTTDASDYAGLDGVILEIHTGEDKETDNLTPDIHCCFDCKRLIFRYYQKNIRLLFSSRSTLTIHI